MLIVIIGAVSYFVSYSLFRQTNGKDCEKWVYYKDTNNRVNSVDKAIYVFAEFLRGDSNEYLAEAIPHSLAGFKETYNLVPYLSQEQVKTREGKYELKQVYNMLLAYLIDREGKIYKYKMCGLKT